MINTRQLKLFFLAQPLTAAVFVAVLLASLRLWYMAIGPLDLAPDEAQYWTWGQHLQASYVTKPPLIAWLIAASTSMFGDTEVGVRLLAIVGQSLLAILGFMLAREAAGIRAGWLAFLALSVTPLFALGGLMMSPDVPSLLLWLAALLLLMKMDWTQPHWRSWIWVGLLIGCAGLAKYSAALFYPLLGIFLLFEHRRWLLKPQVYAAGFISLALQAPVLWWNAQHNWVGFKHVLGQAQGDSRWEGVDSLVNFLASQAGVLGPLVFTLLLLFFTRFHRFSPKITLLWWFSTPIFLAFLINSLQAKIQPNWPVLGTAVALIGLAAWMAYKPRLRAVFIVGLLLNLMVSLVGYDTFLVRGWGINWPIKADPTKEMLGWQELGAGLSRHMQEDLPIFSTRYQTAAELQFYLAGQPRVFYANPGWKRQNQYDYWPWPELKSGQNAYYITQGEDVPQRILAGFTTCELDKQIMVMRLDHVLKKAKLYQCIGYQGLERIKVDKY